MGLQYIGVIMDGYIGKKSKLENLPSSSYLILNRVDRPLPDGGRPTIDLWPDVSEYGPDELFPAPGFTLPDGSTPKLFSSRHPATVGRHFHWMAQHGVDGVFLQRFASQCEVDGRTTGATLDLMRLRDEVLGRVRTAAEKEGRVWAIMYDVGSTPPERLEHLLRTDWAHLRDDLRILESPNYLKDGGRPVIALWGVSGLSLISLYFNANFLCRLGLCRPLT